MLARSRQVAKATRDQRADFPQPVARLAAGPVYIAEHVAEWSLLDRAGQPDMVHAEEVAALLGESARAWMVRPGFPPALQGTRDVFDAHAVRAWWRNEQARLLVPEIIGVAEIGQMAFVTRQAITNRKRTDPLFPEALATLRMGPVFDAAVMRAYLNVSTLAAVA